MFDISWTEFLLIGVVALVVIGPKELPGVMRTLGQWTRKVRGMASDFQSQFQEAMREAEMTDLKKQVDDMAQDFTRYDPLKTVRDDVESIGKDFEKSLDGSAKVQVEQKPATEASSEPGVQGANVAVATEAGTAAAAEPVTGEPLPGEAMTGEPVTSEPVAVTAEPLAVTVEPVVAEPMAASVAPVSTERSG
jgi:sec-independent protein translocase protein TatB